MKNKNVPLIPATPEQTFLGTLLAGTVNPQSDPAIDALLKPAPAGFIDPRLGEIALAIRDLRQASKPVTSAATCRRLNETRRIQAAGGPGFVCGLLNCAVVSALLPDCAARLLAARKQPEPSQPTPVSPTSALAPSSASPQPGDEPWPEFGDDVPSGSSAHARVGKIARLPIALRDQLNSRLLDGEPADEILAWLNSHPETQAVLGRLFDGRPINPQNLSEWRRGGFQDWLVQQQAAHVFLRLSEDAAAIGPVAVVNFAEQLAIGLASRLAIMIDRFDPRTGDLEQQARIAHQLFRDLATLRNAAYKRERLALQKESLALRRAESERRVEREKIKEARRLRAEQEKAARRSVAARSNRQEGVANQNSGVATPPVQAPTPGSPSPRIVGASESSQVKPLAENSTSPQSRQNSETGNHIQQAA